MAEAWAIVGVAVNIATIVDHGLKLASAAISAYDSMHGTTREIESLTILLDDIEHTNSRLQAMQFSHEPRFQSLAKECNSLVNDLRHIMGKLVIREEAPSRTIESGRVAFQSWWKRKDIASIKDRLLEVEARLKDAVARVLNQNQHSLIMAELRALQDEGRIHEQHTQNASAQLENIQKEMAMVKEMVSKPPIDIENPIAARLQDPSKAIKGPEYNNEQMPHTHQDNELAGSRMERNVTSHLEMTASSKAMFKLATMSENAATSDEDGCASQLYGIRNDILQITAQGSTTDAKSSSSHDLLIKLEAFMKEHDSCVMRLKVLKSLYSPDLRRRFADITNAETHTLNWLYNPSRTSLVNWLTSQHGIYWVNGLAGSGKSTLMKFAAGDVRTKLSLEKWAGSLPLHTASHYFWHHGHSIQRSQIGLFRSLLYQMLRTTPSLIPLVCPNSANWDFEFEEWEMASLKACFDRLSQLTSLSAKFCFFVDGLDEYEGDERDLIDTLHLMTSSPHIKICVSSRPWPEFSKEFGRVCPTLVVQNHTLDDMKTYVKRRLVDGPAFQRLRLRESSCDDIVPEIAEKAQGVWLWTFLVTHDLKRAVTREEGLKTIRTILDSFPRSLEDYFEHIISRVEPHYQKDMVRIFMMIVEAAQSVPLFVFRFLGDQDNDPHYAIKAAPERRRRLYGEPFNYYKGWPLRIARARLGFQAPRGPKDEEDLLSHMSTTEQQQFLEFVTEMEKWKTRIHNRCSDLLRISEDPDGEMFLRFRVTFLHRTVADWLRENFAVRMNHILSNTHSSFNPKITLCYMTLMLLKVFPDPHPHTHPQVQASPDPDTSRDEDADEEEEAAKERKAASRYINQITMLTDELLCYVYQLEQTDGQLSEEDLVNLLDDLDATNGEHFKHTANHWTNVRDWPRGHGSDRYVEGGNCNFMALAVQYRILRYVRGELKATKAPAAMIDKNSCREMFSHCFPTGAIEVSPSGHGSLDAWYAMQQSIVHQIPDVRAPECHELQAIYGRLAMKQPGLEVGNSIGFCLDLVISTVQTYLTQRQKPSKIGLVYPNEGERHFPWFPPQAKHVADKNLLWVYCENKNAQSWQDTGFRGLRLGTSTEAEKQNRWNDGQSPHDRHSPRTLHKLGRPLLDYALRPRLVTPLDLPYHLRPGDSGVEPEMVQLLIDQGADVNAKVYLNDGMTVFVLFLVSCYEASRMLNRPRVELVQKWYRSACILLNNGAKMDGLGFVDNGRAMRTEDLLVVLFGEKRAVELRDLSLAYVPPQPAWLEWALWGYHLLLEMLAWVSPVLWRLCIPPSLNRR